MRGKLVLVSAQPEAVQAPAVERNGAAGIVSYAQNQPTAWSGEDPDLLRWGHLDSFARTPTFAFMVTLKQARAWQTRLAAGETVQLQAHVEARRHIGHYDIVTAAKLIREGRLARPARSLRFIWPPEIEGTTILLNARPDLAARLAAVVHMDMVGGGEEIGVLRQ